MSGLRKYQKALRDMLPCSQKESLSRTLIRMQKNNKNCGNGSGLRVAPIAISTLLLDKNAGTRKKSHSPIVTPSVFGYNANEQKCGNP